MSTSGYLYRLWYPMPPHHRGQPKWSPLHLETTQRIHSLLPIIDLSHDGMMQVTLKMKGMGREKYLNNQTFNDQLYDLNSLTDYLMTSPIIKYEVSMVDRIKTIQLLRRRRHLHGESRTNDIQEGTSTARRPQAQFSRDFD